jgi:hypothetical protein
MFVLLVKVIGRTGYEKKRALRIGETTRRVREAA